MNLADNSALSTFKLAKFFFFGGVLLIAQTTWRPFLSFTLSDWFFLAAVLGVLPLLLLHDKIEVPFPRLLLIGLGLILVGGLLSTPGARWPLSSLFSLTKMCYLIVIWFWVGTFLLHRTEDIQKAMIFWAISAGISSAAAAGQMIFGDIIPGTFPHWGRMTGFTEHINDLGGVTSVALVPALYLATHDFQRPWLSIGFWLLACLIVSGVVWSGSLSGVMATAAGLLIWVLLNKTGLKQVLVLIIGSGAIVFLVHMVPTAMIDESKTQMAKAELGKTEKALTERAKPEEAQTGRAMTEPAKTEAAKPEEAQAEREMTEEEKTEKTIIALGKAYRVKSSDPPLIVTRLIQLKEKALDFTTVQTRIENFQIAWKSIAQNVFVGVGLGPQNGITEYGRLVHNLWLSYLYEGGIFAFLGIFLLVGVIAKMGVDIIHSSVLHIRLLGISLLSSFSSFLVLGLAQPIYYKRFMWFPALLLLTLHTINKAKR